MTQFVRALMNTDKCKFPNDIPKDHLNWFYIILFSLFKVVCLTTPPTVVEHKVDFPIPALTRKTVTLIWL